MYVRLSTSNNQQIFSAKLSNYNPNQYPNWFCTTCELFPRHYPMCDCSSRESATVETIYTLFTKPSTNFAVYRFQCQLTIKVYGSYLGQTHVQLVLRKTKTGVTSYKDFTFQSHVMIKEQLKQAVLELAQPLLMNLLPCSCCNIKHYKKSCMHPFLPNTNHENGH